ncbi:MAG: hypothetical protein LBU27_05535 [Candidatus Peribacteria bacterium]|nr:hypothetical protein [Candidatus Peribacteria bacterium]
MEILKKSALPLPPFSPMPQQPLAYALRPTALEGMVGQDGIRQTIRSFLEKGQIPSMIFRGAP